MINVPLSFHQKAQGQVIEPKSRIMVSFEKNSSLIGGDTEYYGSSSQTKYSGIQLLTGNGYGTASTDTTYWELTTETSNESLGNAWGRWTNTKNTQWVNFYSKMSTALSGGAYKANTKYTVLVEWANAQNVSAMNISQESASVNAFIGGNQGVSGIGSNPNGSQKFVLTTKSSITQSMYALRLFLTKTTTANTAKIDLRITIAEGDYGSVDFGWQPYVGGVPSPNPLYPQQIETTTVGNTELCKIDGYQDHIYKGGNVWYVHKEVGKTDLATETWTKGGTGGGGAIYMVCSSISNIKYVPNNRTLGSGLAENYTLRVGSGLSGNSAVYQLAIDTTRVGVNVGFTQVTPSGLFYYALATPTDTPITDPVTLAFLEAQDVGYFTLDQSLLDGTSLLGSSEDNPIQLWDTYDYTDYTDRLVSVDMEHSFEFPYSVQSAIADFVFENTDNYFTPTRGSVIDEYNLPRRPIKIYAGFANETVVPQFVGITEGMVDIDEKKAVAKYTALDFLTEIAELTLDSTIAMRNVRTNEVLAKIVEQFGVLPSQYNFENGDNIIPFVFFDKGQNAGEAIRKLVQAEAGRFWLDEMGILRFQKRYTVTQQPMITLPEYSIISAKPSGANKIINHINITCDLREVQEYQTVYTKKGTGDSTSNLWVVDAGATITRQCSLEDPCYDVQLPTLGHATSVSWFTAKTSGGDEVTEGITTTGELSTNAYTVTFTNSNDFAVEIDEIELWGEPAKVYDVLEYDSYDDESVEKYGEQLLEINDNQFFQSFNQAQNFAVYTLSERANYNANLDLTIKGDFSLQLGDYIEIEGDYAGAYVIDSIKWHFGVGNLETTLKVHKYNPVEYFTLDVSRLDGTDVLA